VELKLSERQRKAVAHLKVHDRITNSEYQSINGVSDVTAWRDLADLLAKGVLVRVGATGRKASYGLRRKPFKNPSKPSCPPQHETLQEPFKPFTARQGRLVLPPNGTVLGHLGHRSCRLVYRWTTSWKPYAGSAVQEEQATNAPSAPSTPKSASARKRAIKGQKGQNPADAKRQQWGNRLKIPGGIVAIAQLLVGQGSASGGVAFC
jgi:hypothetical protein